MTVKLKLIPCAVMALSCLISGCSDSQSTSSGNLNPKNAREFSEADKRAAKALSIGDEQTLAKSEDTGSLGEVCSAAIAGITEKLRLSGSLSDAQLGALAQAQAYYERQIITKKTPDSDDAAEPTPDEGAENPADDPRVAIACLRRFQ